MTEAVKILWYRAANRISKESGTERILSEFLSPRLICEAKKLSGRNRCLFEGLARTEQFDKHRLLKKVAVRLGVSICPRLHLPSAELINRCGLSVPVMRRFDIMPQAPRHSGEPYSLAIAELKVKDIFHDELNNIEPQLAAKSDIADTWRRYITLLSQFDYHPIENNHLIEMLELVARDASLLGGQQVFIGHPEPCSYQFLAGGELYHGRIKPIIFSTLLRYLQSFDNPTARMQVRVDSPLIDSIGLGVTKNESMPVLCLEWDCRKCLPVSH